MDSNTSNDEYLRMDLTKSDLFLEILSFLEGVSQFLGNDFFDASSLSDEDKTKLGEQRRALHMKSNYLWKLFNLSINDGSVGGSYINMESKGQPKHQEQTYDYCSFETDFEEIKKCPYATMTVAEVVSKGIGMEGELIQIDRRSFFGKPKMMHVILIDRWMLIYGSKGEKRPLQTIFVKKCERIPDVTHTNAFKILPHSEEKPSEFQCSTQTQTNEWITTIENALKSKRTSHGYVNVNKSVNIRKLPTPPAITYRKSNKSDDIYEEPDLVTVRKSTVDQIIVEKETNKEDIKTEEEQTYDNVDHSKQIESVILDMPHIPAKLGSFKTPSVCPNYDVPKNNRLVLSEDVTQVTLENKPEVQLQEKDTGPSKTPRKSKELPSTSRAKSDSCSPSTVQNTEEIKEKLRQQGIILTPIKAHPVPPKSSKFSPTKDLNKQTIKNWFRTKLNKTPSDKEKRKSTSDTITHSTRPCNDSSPQKLPITTKSVNNNNGSKVNMIIHQLEANGHLKHLLTKTNVQRRHTIVDDSYEFVSTQSNKEVF